MREECGGKSAGRRRAGSARERGRRRREDERAEERRPWAVGSGWAGGGGERVRESSGNKRESTEPTTTRLYFATCCNTLGPNKNIQLINGSLYKAIGSYMLAYYKVSWVKLFPNRNRKLTGAPLVAASSPVKD